MSAPMARTNNNPSADDLELAERIGGVLQEAVQHMEFQVADLRKDLEHAQKELVKSLEGKFSEDLQHARDSMAPAELSGQLTTAQHEFGKTIKALESRVYDTISGQSKADESLIRDLVRTGLDEIEKRVMARIEHIISAIKAIPVPQVHVPENKPSEIRLHAELHHRKTTRKARRTSDGEYVITEE